jgi:hypothetical protein
VPALHELAGPGLELGFVEPAPQRLEINKHVSITHKKSPRILPRNLFP